PPSHPPHPAPTHPPSFPTRRSSDLTDDSPSIAQNTLARSRDPCACTSRATSHSPTAIKQIMNSRGPHAPAMVTKKLCRITSAPRSEEHTSELQSRSDLVCRLLLEKK